MRQPSARAKKSCFALSLLALIVLLAACAGSTQLVLRYEVAQTQAPGCDAAVAVVTFKDAREQPMLGIDADGQAYKTASNVAEWVSWSLYDELRAAGCSKAKYHQAEGNYTADSVVTGEVLKVNVRQNSATSYTAAVQIRIEIKKAGQVVFAGKFHGEKDNTVFPGSGKAEQTLTEALQLVLADVVAQVRATAK